MVDKRRGLGRGLGALIPSAPEGEMAVPAPVNPQVTPTEETDSGQRSSGRPADLFFERGADSGTPEQPRSYSSALRSGIDRNVLEAQTKRVGKSATRRAPKADEPIASTTGDSERPASEEPKVRSRKTPPPSEADTASDTSSPQEVEVDPLDDEAVTSSSASVSAAPDVSRETASSGDDSIIGVDGDASADLLEVPGVTFAEIALDNIHPNRKQPRTEFDQDELSELVHSIREIGVLQPIVVRPSQEKLGVSYELVMGERRWRASREAGKTTVPAIIRSTNDDDLLRDALLENLHRSALNPLEEAAAYQQLLDDFGCSHDELAGRLGRSRPQISNTLRLMKLPPLVQRRLAAGILSAGHARALLGLEDPAEMEKLAQRIVAEGLSVRSTEEIVAVSGGLRRATKASPSKDGARHERLDYLATSLSDRLDTNVKITLGVKKGRVSIEFASVDDLNRIISVLSPSGDQK